MFVSIARSAERGPAESRVQLVHRPTDSPTCLRHSVVHLGADVHVALDLMQAWRWGRVIFPVADEASGPLVEALIGARATGELRTGGVTSLAVDPVGAAPWLRVAAVDLLDRWLHLPLDQALIDAERAVSRGRAALTLPDGAARTVVLGDALRRARRASRGVVLFLQGLVAQYSSVPLALRTAVERLVDGYDELIEEVDGPDRALSAVGETWRRLQRSAVGPPRPRSTRAGWPAPARPDAQMTSMIDPRQLPARALGLASDPTHAEISLSMSEATGPDAVRVQVPAFVRSPDPDVLSRLAVRLVGRRTARSGGHALLTPAGDGAALLEASVPLCGLDPTDMRVDVFDVLSDLPPARTDADGALQETRRAVLFLGEWRRMVGLAHLPKGLSAPARRLRELATLLRPPGAGAADPVFAGGPSPAELEELAELGDDTVRRRLRGDHDVPLAGTGGAAGLLVAELAALHAPNNSPIARRWSPTEID